MAETEKDFNVADYQKSDEFPPDKEKTWHYPPEKDGWCVVHNALRGELKIFQETLDAIKTNGVGLQKWKIKSLQTAFAGHLEHVDWHHHDEDDAFVPFLKKRVEYPEKLEKDHPTIEAQIAHIKGLIDGVKEGDKVDELCQEWKKYNDMMIPHMKEEEDTALLLMRAYFEPNDLKPLIAEIIKNAPKIEMGSAIYFMGEDRFRNEFMKQEGIPFFVWHVDFSFRLAQFKKRVVKHIEALKTGVPPEPTEPSCIIS